VFTVDTTFTTGHIYTGFINDGATLINNVLTPLGSVALAKTGTGILILKGGADTYTGGTTLTGGTLAVQAGGALGTVTSS